MASEKMIIPKKINVGYQKREGTYTGKLAYVVWTDNKGVIRKENSWKSWSSKDIEKDVFDNIPTEGFVLNKGVGGTRQSYGWNPRNEYIRVYDPRNFEFEISVANLLYILQETNSIKGKGLDGQFVYSWDGKDLVLLPVTSTEYQTSTEYTELQSTSITKKDMIEGAIYKMKNLTKVMYLGRHKLYKPSYSYRGNDIHGHELIGNKYIFLNMDKRVEHGYHDSYGSYIIQTDLSKMATRLTDEADPTYADELHNFKSSINGCPLNGYELAPTKLPQKIFEELKNNRLEYFYTIVEKNNKYYTAYVMQAISRGCYNLLGIIPKERKEEIIWRIDLSHSPIDLENIKTDTLELPQLRCDNWPSSGNTTPEKLKEMKFFTLAAKNEYGNTFDIIGENNE